MGVEEGVLKRHRFSFRAKTHIGQQPPADALHTVNVFTASVKATMERESITLVYNANQTTYSSNTSRGGR